MHCFDQLIGSPMSCVHHGSSLNIMDLLHLLDLLLFSFGAAILLLDDNAFGALCDKITRLLSESYGT